MGGWLELEGLVFDAPGPVEELLEPEPVATRPLSGVDWEETVESDGAEVEAGVGPTFDGESWGAPRSILTRRPMLSFVPGPWRRVIAAGAVADGAVAVALRAWGWMDAVRSASGWELGPAMEGAAWRPIKDVVPRPELEWASPAWRVTPSAEPAVTAAAAATRATLVAVISAPEPPTAAWAPEAAVAEPPTPSRWPSIPRGPNGVRAAIRRRTPRSSSR